MLNQNIYTNQSSPNSFGKSMSLSSNYTTKCSLVTIGRPKFNNKFAPSLQRSSSHLIHSSLDRPHSQSQVASGFNQPFCHSTLSTQTDRQTNRWTRRQVSKISAYTRYIDKERCSKNKT